MRCFKSKVMVINRNDFTVNRDDLSLMVLALYGGVTKSGLKSGSLGKLIIKNLVIPKHIRSKHSVGI